MNKGRKPGVPKLLRVLNDKAALRLLLEEGPQTRTQLAERTSMSKVTASQMVERLENRGLVKAVGTKSGGRGPNASLYAAVGSYAYVVGIEVGPEHVRAACADFTGQIIGRATLSTEENSGPAAVVKQLVDEAVTDAGIDPGDLHRVVVGTPGVIDPKSGDVGFSWDLPNWHAGIREELRRTLHVPVSIENDVNLGAVAEQRFGAGRGVDDFVYAWFGRGLGFGVILGGRFYRGATGAAGEAGFLPVSGVELSHTEVQSRTEKGSFQMVAGGEAIIEIGRKYGFTGSTPEGIVTQALENGDLGRECLSEIATRVALGVASACIVLDPSRVILGGPVGYAGGESLASQVAEATTRIAPVSPNVQPGEVSQDPVIRGGIRVGLDKVEETLFED
ncbi:ROK family transcriptional regulator [Natronoglycomyces albus]|uniref:ROK family transcriptional regulator n=1 Tax=Natronoglycomyces albus TaxID=2811108 RepID=A0A895XL51_9ACTN|nr:ROK family transcriptional regulator [Natronoglycomyces albus]QSB04283.1 ROK family transcriptional regulator [Natronoglycomyces albus]